MILTGKTEERLIHLTISVTVERFEKKSPWPVGNCSQLGLLLVPFARSVVRTLLALFIYIHIYELYELLKLSPINYCRYGGEVCFLCMSKNREIKAVRRCTEFLFWLIPVVSQLCLKLS